MSIFQGGFVLDNLEKVAKIISLLAIPIALWWLGTQYQTADNKAKTAIEYVKLSVNIISNQNEADPQLLSWASKTLNHYSEVKLGEPLTQAIATGTANLAPSSASTGWYTVLGSLDSEVQAQKLVEELKIAKPESLENLQFDILKTKISNHYAVTLGGESNKSEALQRASLVRESGLVSDAFAEKNRGWEH
ncbi:SPOR domain-containing protein [Agarivorans aestuarii]|uniref:SPOR domain-containing protein n=1 Tax=Agarivorans aestuarii TaxID=1563703 RepID=A0ABU7G8X4_9ALTE|nr:SPOR domain-containing protein [Agarivorans aestuarii]MEE1675832.1 SPOR domain-containing protein [Agarivorans aestuarii]